MEKVKHMYIIVGLGNPKKEYDNTRHNIGFMAIDEIAEKNNISVIESKHKALIGKGIVGGQKVILAKPLTFMNLSGESVREALDYYKVDEEEELIGVGTMSYSNNTFKLEYLCVDTDIQSHGAGGKMLEWLENKALEKNAEKIILDARVSAQKFYENHGYKTVGDVFMLSYAPVPHILMEKIL